MAVDKTTVPRWLWIQIPKNADFLQHCEKTAQACLDEDKDKYYLINQETKSLTCEEYYFDDALGDNELNISFRVGNEKEGYVSLAIALSDEILIDILQHSIKKLSRLKTAMEALK